MPKHLLFFASELLLGNDERVSVIVKTCENDDHMASICGDPTLVAWLVATLEGQEFMPIGLTLKEIGIERDMHDRMCAPCRKRVARHQLPANVADTFREKSGPILQSLTDRLADALDLAVFDTICKNLGIEIDALGRQQGDEENDHD